MFLLAIIAVTVDHLAHREPAFSPPGPTTEITEQEGSEVRGDCELDASCTTIGGAEPRGAEGRP